MNGALWAFTGLNIVENHIPVIVFLALRWNTQRGGAIIPKSTHRERMEENLNIWDFELNSEDMDAIVTLDLGHSEIIRP